MECLYCGDCCLRMSPISGPDPCPHIIKIDSFVFCKVYENRPEECRDHKLPFRYCPIGFEMTGCKSPQDAALRIDTGYEMITNGHTKPETTPASNNKTL